ncbi:MAG: hypothetical protein JO353_03170, partial [Phycisphaerae bacterium]|nr:hypothetical protein [Phycisphaerae bacterium]
MDVFKAQLARIQQQLAGLSATQRMLAGSLVAIMVLTTFLWGRYASSSETAPVVDRAFDAQEIVEAQHALKAEGINAKVTGDRVMVPADQQDHAFSVLSYARMLPADTRSAFEDVLKQGNPFDGDEKSKLIFNHAREAQLAQAISTFPGVSTAQVVINSTLERHIGDRPIMPSGTVVLQTRDGADVGHLVDSAAYTLMRTVAGMEANHVTVIVNGRSFKPHDPDNGNGGLAGGDLYEEIDKLEHRYQDKISDVVRNYSNPLVSVSV